MLSPFPGPGRGADGFVAAGRELFVTRGSIGIESTGAPAAGDTVRFAASGGRRIGVRRPLH